jgi:AcrR family transcriptional regulator
MQEPQSASRVAWLQAGQELLRRGGAPSVKLAALTDELGLTTGSFYYHFKGIGEFHDALASFYGREQVDEVLASIAHLGARERLTGLMQIAVDKRMRPLSAAMRDWAGSYPPARAAVLEADSALLVAMETCFVELGYPSASARTRALLFMSAGVARVHAPWPASHLRDVNILDVLC